MSIIELEEEIRVCHLKEFILRVSREGGKSKKSTAH